MHQVATVMMVDAPALVDSPWPVLTGVGVLVVVRWLWRRRAPRAHRGEVWFGMVPFEDGTGEKDRPVLILSTSPRTYEAARLTSRAREARRDFARVPDGVPGLPKESWISLTPIQLPRSRLRRRIGAPGDAFVDWYWRAVKSR